MLKNLKTIPTIFFVLTLSLQGTSLAKETEPQQETLTEIRDISQSENTDQEESLYIVVLNDPRSQRQKGWTGGVGYKQHKNYRKDPKLSKLTRRIVQDFKLELQEQWPIESLNVHCLIVKIEQNSELITELEKDHRVLWVQKYQFFEGASSQQETPTPGENVSLLNLPKIQSGITGKGIHVAIVDSSVDRKHDDLKHAVKSVNNYVSNNKGQIYGEEHGTGMAGVIAGLPNNSLGFRGIAPDVNLHAYRGCWEESNKTRCSTLTLSRALDAITKSPPDILNLSLTGPKDFLLERLLEKISQQGTIIVTAYDRNRPADNRFPSYRPEVLVAKASNQAETLESNVLPLPGMQILTAQPMQKHAYLSGDSLSAASLSGVIALIKQVSPELKSSSIREHLFNALNDNDNMADSLNVCKLLNQLDPDAGC